MDMEIVVETVCVEEMSASVGDHFGQRLSSTNHAARLWMIVVELL